MAFDFGGNFSSNEVPSYECSNQEALDKLATMNNRKAISSDQLFQGSAIDNETQARLKSLHGATQISSDMLFGSNE